MSCSSQSDVLSPVDNPAQNLPPEETLNSPTFQKLSTTLKGLGYEGVGLQYESSKTQELIATVFADPKTHQREIQLIYTGLALSYDPRYKSLTIGAGVEASGIIQFITKNIPARAAAPAKPTK